MHYPRNLFVYILYFTAGLYSCDMTCDFTFNRDLITVHFNPYVNHKSLKLRAYTETDLVPMIDKISTRFSKIEMPSVYGHHFATSSGRLASIIHIPNAFANFNKNVKLETNQNVSYQPKTVQLTTTFHIEPKGNVIFDKVKNLSDSSNAIFPGTVQSISLWSPEITERNFDTIERHLKYARNVLSKNDTFNYQLGTNIDIGVCNQSIYFERILPLLDYVYFDILNKQENLKDGVDITVPIYIKQMETCKEKMNKLQPNMKVGFRLSWQDTDLNKKQNLSSLVYFWGRMNYFASSTSTSLILSEAFDVPYYEVPYNTQGWWRLHKNTTYKNSNEYIFEEKCSLVSNMTYSTNLHSDIQGLSSRLISTSSKKNGKTLEVKFFKEEDKNYWVVVGLSIGFVLSVLYGLTISYKLFIKSMLNSRLNEHEEMVNFATDTESM